MITELRIERFKCFRDQTFRCGPLTVLAGSNGAGKSTVLQALLLMRLSDRMPFGEVPLNGHFGLILGEIMDVLHHGSALDDGIRFTITAGEKKSSFDFSGPEQSRVLRLVDKAASVEGKEQRRGKSFSYLSADRLGPQDKYNATDFTESGINVGPRGEAVGQVLVDSERRLVRDALLRALPSGDPAPRNIPRQTELWLSHVVRPIEIETRAVPEAGIVTLRFKEPGFGSEWTRPANTGFGLTSALPIIVAGLGMEEGGLLLVENPETHLHPAAQSRMGAFLARVAGSGVQVILETHSDHVLNGLRRAAVLDKAIASQDVNIHFFHDAGATSDNKKVGVTTIDLRTNGELSQWPDGFFDQLETDLSELSKARRGK